MKVVSHEESMGVQDVITRAPVLVCMHVLGVAREDVRAMRAATSLVDAGFAVSIFDIGSDRTLPAEEHINGIRVRHMIVSHSFMMTRFRHWTFFRAAWVFTRNLLRLIQTPADIYHALDLPALPACYVAARLRRKPLIFESYELPFSTLALSDMTSGRRLLQAFLSPLINHMMPRCTGVIAVSPPIVEEMQKRYHIPKVSLIRNILPYQPIAQGDRLRHLLALSPEVRIALYQGYLQPDRGLDTLVRAARFLERDTIIVMMGKNKLATRSQLEALIAEEKVGDRVKIIPDVPYNDLLGWTSSADIGLIVYPPDYSPNIQMLLPNKLFEFLMAGLPVLSSSLDAVVEVIKTYDVGRVVRSIAPADIGAEINAMLTDRDALALMNCNALDAARQELNWEKEQRHLVHLYREVFAHR
jgi:glycosyltransferase involved in cell wall biosynthesis